MRRILTILAAQVIGIALASNAVAISFTLGTDGDGSSEIRVNTPLGNTFGSVDGEFVLGFAGDFDGAKVSILSGSYIHTTVDANYMPGLDLRVITDSTDVITEVLDIGALNGSLASGTITWSGPISTLANGTIDCSGALCGLAGLPVASR
jgi:hypothetical protein